MLAQKLLGAMAGGSEQLFVDDCFATVVRTGTGASATITTGFQPNFIWSKSRSTAGLNNLLFDSSRGANAPLRSDTTDAQMSWAQTLTGFTSTGYTLGSDSNDYGTNWANRTYVDWVFAKKAKFFDCGTYTGNGVAGRQIPHSLGVAPGMVIVKQISGPYGGQWWVYHRSLGSGSEIQLQSTAAKTNYAEFGADPTATYFTVSSDGGVNGAGASYVWYAFAHDTSAEGIIQCGSFTTNGSGAATVTPGFEPQFLVAKNTQAAENWMIADSMRGMPVGSADAYLSANTSGAEATYDFVDPTATGFNIKGLNASQTYIYLAIRRPNKPPTTGTQVYNAIARTGTGAAATVTGVGFAPDLLIDKRRNAADEGQFFDRLRGPTKFLWSPTTDAEQTISDAVTSFDMDGVSLGSDASWGKINFSGRTYINHFFKRAPGVFSICAYTGTGSATTVAHDLGVAPELMIVKARSSAGYDWAVYAAPIGNTKFLWIDTTDAERTSAGYWNNTSPTATVFSVGAGAMTNTNAVTYIAYLFATKAGISKVGSYTGNGSSQTIDCGFSAGARFVMIKAVNGTGDWFIFDTARGITAGGDPYLVLNRTAAENDGGASGDLLDPHSSGFIVNVDLNSNGTVYLFLAFS